METTFMVSGQSVQTQQQQQLNRRSRMETYCDIVRAIGAGAEKPTHIMYKANLSWTVMQGYIKALESQGLILAHDSDGKRLYELTERGFGLLKQYLSIKSDLRLSPEDA
ncbi:MAG: winged helix-turn-helix domain-containing protein [Nitrososphaerales archaeon]